MIDPETKTDRRPETKTNRRPRKRTVNPETKKKRFYRKESKRQSLLQVFATAC